VTDAAVVGRLLREYHLRGVRPSGIRRLSGSVHGTSVTYHVEHDGEPAWVLRAYRADGPVLAQFSGSAAETAIDWLVGRARTLACLADAGYPAPRPVPVRSGELVGVSGQWLTWAITFIDGPAMRPSADELERLGGTLGQLHEIGIPAWTDAAHEPGKAAWHPEAAVVTTLARLDAVAPLLPADWRPMHAAFLDTAQAVRRSAGRLPAGLVHGDAWPGTAISNPGGPIILIDWESAGLGLPVLDFGNTLAECHLDADSPPDRPQAWLVQPDERRIAAVAGGYSAVRTLTAAEREMLPDAVRFGAAFAGAIHLEAALTGGAAGPAMDARLARLRNRLSISDTVAELALRHLPGAGPAVP
jgi:Ser/Thr protein kinase RdoA (MazF antagonist)